MAAELLEEARQVSLTSVERQVRESEPLYRVKFGCIEFERLSAICANDVPQRHIRVPRGETNRFRTGHHQRRLDGITRSEA